MKTPQEELWEQFEKIPLSKEEKLAVREGVLKFSDEEALSTTAELKKMFKKLPGLLKKIEEARLRAKAKFDSQPH